jgi:hypothetical protein
MDQGNAVAEHTMRVHGQSRRRTRSVSVKVTDAEYPALSACAETKQMKVAEWGRYALLEAARQSVAVQAGAGGIGSGGGEYTLLLAELCAFRAAVLNVLFAMAKGEPLTAERMQELLARAEAGAAQRAAKLMESVQHAAKLKEAA